MKTKMILLGIFLGLVVILSACEKETTEEPTTTESEKMLETENVEAEEESFRQTQKSENNQKELTYGFADAKEGAALIAGNKDYLNSLSQHDLCFRLQKWDATLEEYIAFAMEQTMDFTEEEKEGISAGMQRIMEICRENHYVLPDIGEITFVRTTMKEESGVTAYTHGTQIYMGDGLASMLSNDNKWAHEQGTVILLHELFHCLTRNDARFREDMYGILGFRIREEEFDFSQEIRQQMVANPDVEKHDAYATFKIDGKDRDCVVILTTVRPFENPGDNLFALRTVRLVPIDDLTVAYPKERAENFWEVFGKNTDYVIDPEEALADNFSLAVMKGTDGVIYKSPEIIQAICDYLKSRENQTN